MTTKMEPSILKNNKNSNFTDNSSMDNYCQQFSNLNLNQSQKCSNLTNIQSKNKLNNNTNFDYCNTIKNNKISNTWNKSIKTPKTFEFTNQDNSVKKKINERHSNATGNSSTLSLHITAYENSIVESGKDTVTLDKNKNLKRNGNSIKKCPKQFFVDSCLNIQNPFELPRQQQDNDKNNAAPEISQFKASQKLFNPNESNMQISNIPSNQFQRYGSTSDGLNLLQGIQNQECTPELQQRVGGNSSSSGESTAIAKAAAAAASLHRPMALPTELTKSKPIPINNKPGPSSSSIASSFSGSWHHQNHNRGIKRSAAANSVTSTTPTSWTDDEQMASILSMANKFSTSTISDRRKASISKPMLSSSNDPSDVLLHQLSQVCEQAQRTAGHGPSSKVNNFTITTVLESDRNSSTLKSTKLANHFISCFVVGGEIRLCSPQIYSVIMKDVHEDDLTHWIREYNIVDHMASHEQITSLKLNRAIPPELGSCGLMTKTNAERLVGALIDPNNYRTLPDDKRDKFDPILVEHDCFGSCEGRLFSALFPGPCVECTKCNCLMTTEAFCRHSHFSGAEKQYTEPCHWGFDAANWSKYLRLHHLAENNQESVDRFYSFIKNHHLQLEDTLEDNILAKKSMISAPFSALAAQLLAQQQQLHQQQQIGGATTSSANNNGGGVSSSLPSSSFMPPTSSHSSTAGSAGTSSSNPLSNLLPLLQLQQSLGSNNIPPQQQQQVLAQLQAIMNQQQHPQAQTSGIPALLQYLQQQQMQQNFQSTISSLRNATAATPGPMTDESDIPRKRAHTISEMPSSSSASAMARPPPPAKQDDFSLSSISFGMLASDQQLMTILNQCTEGETTRRLTDLINLSIAQRVQPIADDNSRLRKENQKLQEELQLKNDVLARIAAAGLQQQQSQHQHRFSSTTPSSMIPGSSTSSSHLHNSIHQQHQHPPQIVEQDSDIEIDEEE